MLGGWEAFLECYGGSYKFCSRVLLKVPQGVGL